MKIAGENASVLGDPRILSQDVKLRFRVLALPYARTEGYMLNFKQLKTTFAKCNKTFCRLKLWEFQHVFFVFYQQANIAQLLKKSHVPDFPRILRIIQLNCILVPSYQFPGNKSAWSHTTIHEIQILSSHLCSTHDFDRVIQIEFRAEFDLTC